MALDLILLRHSSACRNKCISDVHLVLGMFGYSTYSLVHHERFNTESHTQYVFFQVTVMGE